MNIEGIITKEDVKSAIREVMDDLSITYAHGVGKFIDSVLKSVADAADAYDEFYTKNLIHDRPELATLFLDLRLKSLTTVAKLVEAKTKELGAVRTRVKAQMKKSNAKKHTASS